MLPHARLHAARCDGGRWHGRDQSYGRLVLRTVASSVIAGLCLGLCRGDAAAAEISPCRVLSVSDGDTIVVATPDAPTLETKVRLKWIATPEVHDNPHSGEMAEGKTAAT